MSMEEQSGNLADETTETAESMPDSQAHPMEELRKRRSTRIMQAVPLSVTGVDALGRPFTERTSTLIINCHGCRYQSKHYVLKNMWVTLEVPHPEPGHESRNVRGRVAWIQRPRTVRQLFQVALELETPGNTWGIAFPPPDWFPAPEPGAAVPLPENAESVTEPPKTAEIHLPLTEPEPTPQPQDNLRLFPAPISATDASLQLARHMARLVADAKQQLQATAREIAAQAVVAERRVSLEDWEQRLASSREQLERQVASALEKIQSESETQSVSARKAAAEALQRELPGWIAPQLEQLTRELTQQISDRGLAEREEHGRHISSALDALRSVVAQAEESAARLNLRSEEARKLLADRASESSLELEEAARQNADAAEAHREALQRTAKQAQESLASAVDAAQASWQSQLSTETQAAAERWQATLQHTVAEAQEKATAGLADTVRNATSQLQEETARQRTLARESLASVSNEVEQRIRDVHNGLFAETERQAAAHRDSVLAAKVEAEQHLATLRGSLEEEAERRAAEVRGWFSAAAAEAEQRAAALRASAQAQTQQLDTAVARAAESTERLDHQSARLETAQQQALASFQSQIDDVLTLHRNELHRSSETLLEEIDARIHASFDETCRNAVASFDQQVDSIVQPHISRTEEAIHRLAGGRSLLDAAMALQQDRIRTAADEAFAESLAHFRENLGGVEQLLQEAASTVSARNLLEYEAKASDLRHKNVDDLMKSAEWYEKRAQTQIQHLTEKTLEHAEQQFREKAREVSSVFAGDLDNSSRSFVAHTQTQLEETVRESFARARALFAEAAETTTAAFTDEIQRQARTELDGFGGEAQRALNETRDLLGRVRIELAQTVSAEQDAFLRQFRERMSGAIEDGVSSAQQQVRAGLGPLLDTWKSTVESHRNELRGTYQELSRQAAEQHRDRLENVSNQWMLATVATLNHQSREAVSSIAAIAEDKLRETCAQVFANVGDALRERLQKIAEGFAAHEPQPSQAPQTPMSRSQSAGGTGSST